jgi:hypothetical protein
MKSTQSPFGKLQMEDHETYGKYGGIFVPDPFTPALDALAQKATAALVQDEFVVLRTRLLETLGYHPPALDRSGKLGEATIYRVPSQTRAAIVSGYVALAKMLEAEVAVGIDNPKDLIAVVKALEAVGSKDAYIVLNRALGGDPDLVDDLDRKGWTVEIEKCAKLFNDPAMYAFQRYISNPLGVLFCPLETNIGPYPFLSLTAMFLQGFGFDLLQAMEEALKTLPAACVVGGYPGTEAVAVLQALSETDVRLISVEESFELEREDCYCGAYTRVAVVGKREHIFSPELLAAWDAGDVDRVYAPSYNAALATLELAGEVVVVEGDR